jgi:hypothetical protein
VSWFVSAGLRRFGFDDLHERASSKQARKESEENFDKNFHETAAAGAAASVFLSDSDMAS